MRRFVGAFAALLVLCLCSCAPKTLTWQEQYDLGVRYLSEGNYEQAILAFTAAIEIDPRQAEAYQRAAEAYEAAGEAENARLILGRGFTVTGEEALLPMGESLPPREGSLWVLTYRTAYRMDGSLLMANEYEYDEYGYMTRYSSKTTEFKEESGMFTTAASDLEYFYEYPEDGEVLPYGSFWRSCISRCYDNIRGEELESIEISMNLGTSFNHSGGWTGQGGTFTCHDALALPEHRQEVDETGQLAYLSITEEDQHEGYYALYVFDGNGNPVGITTWSPDGTLTGATVLEWARIDPLPLP